MAVITITLPEEIKVKLAKIENKSGLIASLLKEYFNKDDNPEILKIKRDKLKNDMETKLKEMNYTIEVKEKQSIEAIELKKLDDNREQRIEDAVAKRVKEMKANKNKASFKDKNAN